MYPSFLWAFLFLLIPILIHFFSFQRHKKLYFSSILFLKKIEKENRSVKKLKHLLILLLRLCALSCLILAFARPYFPKNKTSNKKISATIIYIDNSFSMTAKGAEGELLSEAIESARKIINQFPSTRKILLHTNKLNGIEGRILNKKQALNELDKIKPYQLARPLEKIIFWEKEKIKKEFKNEGVQVLHFSDFQKTNLQIKRSDKERVKGGFYPVQFAPQSTENIFVDSVWFDSPIKKVAENSTLNIRIRNIGETPKEGVLVQVQIKNLKRTLSLDIPANGMQQTKLNYKEEGPGYRNGKITISDNQLFWDDEYFFSYQIKEKTKILVINSEDKSEAISKIYNLESLFGVNDVAQESFSQDMLYQTDLVVLNGFNNISSATVSILEDFVNNGGSLSVFPGSKTNPNELNLLLNKLEMPLLGNVIESGTKIKEIAYKSPFFKGVFDREEKNIILPGITKVYQTKQSDKTRSQNIINLQNGLPLFCVSSSQRQVFLFTSSLSNDFGSFTLDALFPSLLLRMGELSQKQQPLFLTIGKQKSYYLNKALKNSSAIHLIKGKIDLIPKTRRSKKGLSSRIVLGGEQTQKLTAGIYKITNQNKEIGQLALNYDRIESKTKYATKNQITSYYRQNKLNLISYKKHQQGKSLLDNKTEKEWWKIFLVLSFCFFFLELLALKFSRVS